MPAKIRSLRVSYLLMVLLLYCTSDLMKNMGKLNCGNSYICCIVVAAVQYIITEYCIRIFVSDCGKRIPRTPREDGLLKGKS